MPTARSVDEVLAAKRLAVALRAKGKTHAAIAEQTGLSRQTVADALRRYAEGGDAALVPGKRGRKAGSGRHLSAKREFEVILALRDSTPADFGIEAAGWSRAAVMELIASRFKFAQFGLQPKTRLRTVDRYLARWAMTEGRRVDDLGLALVLWELLGWYPGPTGRLNALARSLAGHAWMGRTLFNYFRQPRTLWRRCVELERLEFHRRSPDAHLDDEAEMRSDGRAFTHRTRNAMVCKLWRSADRASLMASTRASSDGQANEHWSVRLFMVDVRDVYPGRTQTRKLGRIVIEATPWRALFVGLLNLRTGGFSVELLRDDAADEHADAEDPLEAALLRQLRLTLVNAANTAPVVLHLPIGYCAHLRYDQIARWASSHGVRVVEDMLPPSSLAATPEVVHHRLAVRACSQAPLLHSSAHGWAWGAPRG